jgi:hypothetical protein
MTLSHAGLGLTRATGKAAVGPSVIHLGDSGEFLISEIVLFPEQLANEKRSDS